MFAAFAAITLSSTRTDPDLWGHLRFGLDWWRTFTLPSADPYSFTQDRPWVNHEWLSEALMAAAYLVAGTTGLILLKSAVLAAALGVLARRLRGSTALVTAATLSLAITCALPIGLTVRPHLWSVLGLVLLATLLDTREAPRAPRIAAGAGLFMFWANLHGGWITGAAVLGVYAAVRVLREREGALNWCALVGASLAGTLANPYGLGLWRFLAGTVRPSRPDVAEWQPLGLDSPLILWVPLATIFLIALALTASRRTDNRPPIETWAVLLLLIIGGMRVERVAPLMGPASLAFLAPLISRAWGRKGTFVLPGRTAEMILVIPAAVAIAAAVTPVTRAFSCIPITDEWAPDLVAAAHLRGLTGRLLTTFDWGEYVIWHFGPDLRVSIDGRRETIYSDDVVQWHRAFERGDGWGQSVVGELAPDYAWLRSDRPAAKQWLIANGYRIDAHTAHSFVAVRGDLPTLALSDAVMPSCFP